MEWTSADWSSCACCCCDSSCQQHMTDSSAKVQESFHRRGGGLRVTPSSMPHPLQLAPAASLLLAFCCYATETRQHGWQQQKLQRPLHRRTRAVLPHCLPLRNAPCDVRLLPAMLPRLYAWALPATAVAALCLPVRGPQGLRSMPAPLLTAPLLPGAAAAGQLLARVLL